MATAIIKSSSQLSATLKQLKDCTKAGPHALKDNSQFYLLDGKCSTHEEFHKEIEESSGHCCALVGHAMIGKSMCLLFALRKWAQMDRCSSKHYLYIDLRCMKTSTRGLSQNEVLCTMVGNTKLYNELSKTAVAEIVACMMATEGENFVIILDHFNELSLQQHPIITEVLLKNLLPMATTVVAGTFCILDDIKKITKENFRHYILRGIHPQHQLTFLESLNTKFNSSLRTLEFIRHSSPELCISPGLIHAVLIEYSDTPPITATKMMEKLIVAIINDHFNPPQPVKSLSALPADIQEEMKLLGQLAYQATITDIDQFSVHDLTTHVILHRGEIFSVEKNGLGLLVQDEPDDQGTKTFKFIHKNIQEFLTAYFLAMEPTLDQLSHVYHNIDAVFQYGKHSNVCSYFFGMGPVINEKLSTATKVKSSETTWALKPLLETVIGGELRLDEEPNLKQEKLLYVYKLLLESQDTNLVQKFLSKREKYLHLGLDSAQLSEPLVQILAFVITYSGITKWSISASESTYHTADYIAMLVRKGSSKKVEVHTTVADSKNFIVQPFFQSGKQLDFYPINSMYVRCLREILHRILQMYSPIKLKSSGTDSSYVSFLACECLKKKFENEGVLTIEPIHAVHWIPIKVKTKHGASKYSSSEETELHRHMTRHNMEHLEMVLMMSPLPNRICFTNPSDEKKIEIIELCRSGSPEIQDGKIIETLKGHIRSNGSTATNIAQETNINTTSSSATSELVALPNIIPATFKGLLGLVPNSDQSVHEAVMARQDIKAEANASKMASKAPDTDTQAVNPRPEMYTTVENKTFYNNQQELSALKRATARQHQPEMAEEYPISVESFAQRESSSNSNSTFAYQQSHRPYLSFNQPQSLSSQPSTQTNVRQSSLPPSLNIQRQVAVPAGTILHSVDRDMFPPDTIQRLPDEGSLIRKGGNGTVFTAVYGHIEFAVKKTAFRNREFQIHKKLKHPNIIQLSCFMFGPPQPQLKRRYYCYHFMPRVTGDLARMVTDKAELTMMSLSKKYENNPLKLGSIQGNWKFILKELLKGLNYMHSLNIIHRDMKSSNILIKMNCSCDNPLVCTCSTKCGVKISDFDSALELDANGLLQSTPYVAAQVSSQQKLERIYQITPVGTDGYRSPESSQFILTNNLEALKPSLTVKSDIWSTGLIMMRMLNGTNGPTTQQKLSTLLLYYENEIKLNRSSPLTPKFAKVKKKEVDKIMGLDRLQEAASSNSWMTKAVECIKRCVEVDPEKRPTPSDLIKDPFLF